MLYNVTFCFIKTGSVFIKDGKQYYLPRKSVQSEMSYLSGMSFRGKEIKWPLYDSLGVPLDDEAGYVPFLEQGVKGAEAVSYVTAVTAAANVNRCKIAVKNCACY